MTAVEAINMAVDLFAFLLFFGVKVHLLVAAMLCPLVERRCRITGRRPQGPYRVGQRVTAGLGGYRVPATVAAAPWRCPAVLLRFELPGASASVWMLDVEVVPDQEGEADA